MRIPIMKRDYTYLKWALYKESPGTPGVFLKAYEEIDNVKHYYKLSNFSTTVGCYGHEALNEIVAQNIANMIGLHHLEYTLRYGTIKIDDKEYTEYFTDSENFCRNYESKISLETLYDLHHNEKETPLEFVYRMGWRTEIEKMFVFDYLICNRDRHGANIEVIYDGENYKLAPFFDNGLSFFCFCNNNVEAIEAYKTDLDPVVNNYLGTRSLKDNLDFVPLNIIENISDLDFTSETIFEGLYGVNLPFFEQYCNKIMEILKDRSKYLKNYLCEKNKNRSEL